MLFAILDAPRQIHLCQGILAGKTARFDPLDFLAVRSLINVNTAGAGGFADDGHLVRVHRRESVGKFFDAIHRGVWFLEGREDQVGRLRVGIVLGGSDVDV